jgi:hypothetical protein
MLTRLRSASAALLLASAGLTACTTDATPPAVLPEAALPELAAATLGQLSDSARLMGDAFGAATFAEAQAAVAGATEAGTLRVTENGVTQDWSAISYRTVLPASCGANVSNQLLPGCMIRRPSVVAWSRVAPARTLMLSAPEGAGTFTGATPLSLTTTSLTGQYHDRSVTLDLSRFPVPAGVPGSVPGSTTPGAAPGAPGAPGVPSPSPLQAPVLWAVSGGSSQLATTTGTTPCSTREGAALLPGMFGRCLRGTASVRFDVTVQALVTTGNTVGTQRRTLAVGTTTLPALVWLVDSVRAPGVPVPPPSLPPAGVPPQAPTIPQAMASRLEVLSATRDSVRVRFTVRAVQPVTLAYATAQRFDIEALGGGAVSWRWGQGMAFAQVASSEALAAGAERQYEGVWRAPTRGAWVLRARTANTGGPVAESVAPVVVP